MHLRTPRLALVLALAAVACAPRAAPLTGAPVPARLPEARLVAPRQIVFRWEMEDGSLVARGEGVARVAPPDSARLDFFLDGGAGGGTAFLIGDVLDAPGGDLVRRLLPPPPLLWASLGRLAVPPGDTVARLDDAVLRADIGSDPVYRVAFQADSLRRLERIDDGRVHEWVTRDADGRVEYRHEASGRRLSLSVTRVVSPGGFDASIWSR
jgi:hypothetical protein